MYQHHLRFLSFFSHVFDGGKGIIGDQYFKILNIDLDQQSPNDNEIVVFCIFSFRIEC